MQTRSEVIRILLRGVELLNDGVAHFPDWVAAIEHDEENPLETCTLECCFNLAAQLRESKSEDLEAQAARLADELASQVTGGAGFSIERKPRTKPDFDTPPESRESSVEGDILNVQGQRSGLGNSVFLGVLGVGLGVEFLGSFESSNTSIPLAFIFVFAFVSQLIAYIRRPYLCIDDGNFSFGHVVSYITDCANVRDIRFNNGSVFLDVVDASRIVKVDPGGIRTSMTREEFEKIREQAIPNQVFRLEQINQIRKALNLAESEPAAEDTSSIEYQLSLLTPRLWVTPTLLTVMITLFVTMTIAGVDPINPSIQSLTDWGGNIGSLPTSGQWWRFVTSIFLHVGLVHLFFNAWVLWDIGRTTERLIGNVGFLLIFIFSGIGGSVASAMFNEDQVSAGASGAIFGLFGLLLAISLRRSETIPKDFLRKHRISVIACLLSSIMLGMSVEWIDNAAHIGGLLTGFACGMFFAHEIAPSTHVVRQTRAIGLGIAGLVLCITTISLLPEKKPGTMAWRRRIDQIELNAEMAFPTIYDKFVSGVVDGATAKSEIQTTIIEPLKQMATDLDEAGSSTGIDNEKLHKLNVYIQFRIEGWQLLAIAMEQNNFLLKGQAIERFDKARAVFEIADPPTNFNEELARYVAMEDRVTRAIEAIASRTDITSNQRADRIETEALAEWRIGLHRWKSQTSTLSLTESQSEFSKNLTKYMRLMEESWILYVEGLREDNAEKISASETKGAAANELIKQLKLPQ